MHDLTPFPAAIGGALIGLSASLLLLTHGKVAGISGIVGRLLRRDADDRGTSGWFLAGLLAVGALTRLVAPSAFASSERISIPLALAAGLLVGVGTQLGNGCTSGHGVCGISRLSVRSTVATSTFVLTAFVTTFVLRHVLGGGR
jgi:uncharacterized membrane protein YedE/YeeE